MSDRCKGFSVAGFPLPLVSSNDGPLTEWPLFGEDFYACTSNDFKYDLLRATESLIIKGSKRFFHPRIMNQFAATQARDLKTRASEMDVRDNEILRTGVTLYY